MNNLSKASTFSVACSFGNIAACRWQAKTSGTRHRKILALHGWLDNANSFDLLAPLLNAEVVAIDLAGHGQSDYRGKDAEYNIWNNIYDVLEVVDQLKWDKFELMGHSLGAAVATLTTGVVPQRVVALHLIDGGLPVIEAEGLMPDKIQQILTARATPPPAPTLFPNRQTAIAVRASNKHFPMPLQSAEILAQRGLVEMSDGRCYWQYDPRLKHPSIYLTERQALAFAQKCTMPTQIIIADEGVVVQHPKLQGALQHFPNAQIHTIVGSHHCHLEAERAVIAEHINNTKISDD